jgi:hypothetical protein
MVELRDLATGQVIGSITDEQFQFMQDQLEEESGTDTDYYLNKTTIDVFDENGADPQLIKLLREAIGDRTEMEIQWSRK